METLMAQMKQYCDDAPGESAEEKGCRDVLYLLDEAGTIKLPSTAWRKKEPLLCKTFLAYHDSIRSDHTA
jgi:hypothetical protein